MQVTRPPQASPTVIPLQFSIGISAPIFRSNDNIEDLAWHPRIGGNDCSVPIGRPTGKSYQTSRLEGASGSFSVSRRQRPSPVVR